MAMGKLDSGLRCLSNDFMRTIVVENNNFNSKKIGDQFVGLFERENKMGGKLTMPFARRMI